MTIPSSFCTFLVRPSKNSFDLVEVRRNLESGTEKIKIEAMKSVLEAVANGEPCGPLVMHIIRFVMPNQKNKLLKKLVLLFFEMAPKVDAEGKLLQEMILLCNALRNDLQHPNEYVRGVTLRFVCKLTEPELLEPLLPVVRSCLEHNHPYVRRNAIFAVYSIYRTNDYMILDAPELIEQVLAVENDASCQRNAFVMLSQTEPNRASSYFDSIAHKIDALDAQLQLALIEFMLSDASTDISKRSKYTRYLFSLLTSASQNMVKFEACSALMALTNSPNAIKAIAQCYMDMAIKESDNNAKLVILDRLRDLQAQHGAVVNENILDVLRVLNSNDVEIRKRSIRLVLNGLTVRIAEEVVGYFRKEFTKTLDSDGSRSAIDYKRELLRAIHVCASKFSKTCPSAVQTWIEFFTEPEPSLLTEVSGYLKEVLEAMPELRSSTIATLTTCLTTAADSQAMQSLLWILGEFTGDTAGTDQVLKAVISGLGELPMVDAEEKAERDEDAQQEMVPSSSTPSSGSSRRKVLADGTYATESALSITGQKGKHFNTPKRRIPNLKKALLDGHFEVGASISMTLSKLALKLEGLLENPARINSFKANVLLISTSIIRLGLSRFPTAQINKDIYDRIMLCIRVLAKPDLSMETAFAKECKDAFEAFIANNQRRVIDNALGLQLNGTQIADSINFRFVKAREEANKMIPADFVAKDLQRALEDKFNGNRLASSLSKVVQLTGFSDPIYVETYVNVSHNDILLDILIVNQTEDVLQSVSIDLSTSGDLKVVDKPACFTVAAGSFATVKAGIKVSSTNNGLIYGCITYGTVEIKTVVIANISIDIVDYIKAKEISEIDFRQSWIALEWENKINIAPVHFMPGSNPSMILKNFLESLLHATHLACITPGYGLCEGGDYLAANMYAKSVFGEDVLANICLERQLLGDEPQVSGHVRLRSKTQGIAVALGDKINSFVASLSQRRSN